MDSQRLHSRFNDPDAPPPSSTATYPPPTTAPFHPFPSHPPVASQSLPQPPRPDAPLYDSASAIRGPWTPSGAIGAITTVSPSPALLRSVSNPQTRTLSDADVGPSQLGLVDETSDAGDDDAHKPDGTTQHPQDDAAAQAIAAAEEMRRSQGSRGSSHNERQIPPRRQQQRAQQPPPSAFPMGGFGMGMPGVFGQTSPRDPQQQQQQQGPYQPRGYSPVSYPSPMQVMLGQHQYNPNVGVYPGSYDATQGMIGMTSPVQFGPPAQYVNVGVGGFQRISPDPMPTYATPQRVPTQQQQQRGAYPTYGYAGSPVGGSPPLGHGQQLALSQSSRLLQQQAQQQQQQQQQQAQGSTFPSLYSPSPPQHTPYTSPTVPYPIQTSPTLYHSIQQPRYTPYSTPYTPHPHPQSPEESIRAQGGTWIYVPDPSAGAGMGVGGFEGGYGGTYGLGFGQGGRGEDYAGSPTSPGGFQQAGSSGGYRAQGRQEHTEPDPPPVPPRPPAAPVPPVAGPSTQQDPPTSPFRQPQVSQIPFPSLSGPGQQPQQPRHQRRASSPSRKPYHPNPPANRSEWVMWVGNVPPDATHDELWRFFNQPVPARPFTTTSPSSAGGEEGGVSSVFLISRSNCAFVNFNEEQALERAVAFFNGRPIRPGDPRCPRLVCRVRRRDDDLRAGVGGQRGMGMHTRWVKEREEGAKEGAKEKEGKEGGEEEAKEGGERQKTLGHSGSSGSFASTSSSFLQKYFPKRYFILKSLTQFDLNLSVERGLWATQAHNEPVLDQAYRTSQDVYLIFGANKSGEFYGYARMAGPVTTPPAQKSENRVSWASRTESSHSSSKSIESPVVGKRQSQPEMIAEDEEGENRAEEEPEAQPEQPVQDGVKEYSEPEPERQQTAPPEIHEEAPSPPQDVPSGEDRGDVEHPQPEHVSSLLSPGDEAPSVAASPAPMTQDESQSLEALEPPKPERPVHHPHIRRSRPHSPSGAAGSLPTPEVPTGEDVPRPPAPMDVASAPAEVGPERKRFTFDTPPEPSHTIDSSDLHSASLAAVLASQGADFELRMDSLPTFAERQASLGVSAQEAETDRDGVKRKDTAPTQEEKEERSGSSDEPPQPHPSGGGQPAEPEPVQETPAESSAAAAQSPTTEAPFRPAGADNEEGTWGTPFRVDWIRVEPLPFYRTRHLRNPWNNDREVKVSRDGTEIEPTVGARLLEEWDRLQEEPMPAPAPARRPSRPPFRAGYSTPAQVQMGVGPPAPGPPMAATPGQQIPISPYMHARDPAGGVPQWLFTRPQPWQQ